MLVAGCVGEPPEGRSDSYQYLYPQAGQRSMDEIEAETCNGHLQ